MMTEISHLQQDLAVELFGQAQSGYRAGRGLVSYASTDFGTCVNQLPQPTLLRLQEKAHGAMDAYKSGSWVKNSATDSQLLQGLKGYHAFVHREMKSEEGALPPQPAIQRPDVMTSLENIPLTLEEYLRSFNIPGGHPENLVRPNFSSSDEYLYGVISGNFGSRNVQMRPQEQNYQSTGSSPMSFNPPTGQAQDPSLFPGLHTVSNDSSSPRSDGASSTYSSGGPTLASNPPPLVDHILPPTFGPSMIAGEETQATVLWDKFLQELGI
jgi:hypothetical protein